MGSIRWKASFSRAGEQEWNENYSAWEESKFYVLSVVRIEFLVLFFMFPQISNVKTFTLFKKID